MTAARRRYSPTVDRLTPIVTAICRSLTPRACLNLRTSRTFRIGALSAGIGPPLHGRKGRLVRDSIADSESFRSASQGGRLQSEWVADFRRNRWPDCVGISGRLPSDYADNRSFFRGRASHWRIDRAVKPALRFVTSASTFSRSRLSEQAVEARDDRVTGASYRVRFLLYCELDLTAYDADAGARIVGDGHEPAPSSRIPVLLFGCIELHRLLGVVARRRRDPSAPPSLSAANDPWRRLVGEAQPLRFCRASALGRPTAWQMHVERRASVV